MSKIIQWVIEKIKSGHPKLHTCTEEIAAIVILLLFNIWFVYIMWENHKYNIVDIPDNTVYIVNYFSGRHSDGAVLVFNPKFKNNKLDSFDRIQCVRLTAKTAKEQLKSICYKENKGKGFVGYDIKGIELYDKTYAIKSGKFIPYKCSNCKPIYINSPNEEIDEVFNGMKNHRNFYIYLMICLFVYLIFQFKYRICNK